MKKKEKQLLLKDLCARIPYGVRMKELEPTNGIELELYLTSIYKDNVQVNTKDGGVMATVIDAFKPYLRPMSSMTEEEYNVMLNYLHEQAMADISSKSHYIVGEDNKKYWSAKSIAYFDWLNAHHFDYRGLIEKGLALEAPEYMYKIK